MQKQVIANEIWAGRIPAAEAYKKKYEGLFFCDMLEDYYEGRQWDVQNPFEKYTVNKVYETVQIKLDQFIPTFPKFLISARAGNSDYNLELAGLSANLKQDVVNTIISDPNQNYVSEIRQAYKQSYFRFGIIEIGYAADWIMNPNAPKTPLDSDKDVNNISASHPKQLKKWEPKELPANERVYVKQINAKNFYVGGQDKKYLHQCGWYGYFEYVPKEDILALPGLMNRAELETEGSTFYVDDYIGNKNEADTQKDCYKVWKIWDNRFKLQLIILDGSYITISQKPFTRQAIFDYRPDLRVKAESFYPIPPVFHWICSQNELNETREQLKSHRRRFVRKFQIQEQMIDEDEIEKFETGPDGSLIVVKQREAITPVQDAPLGSAMAQAMVTSADDINQLSGTSSALRGKADRTTATEANIINVKADIRENAENDRVKLWVSRIGREILLTCQDKFILGMWVQLTQDPGETLFQTYQENQPVFDWVSGEDIDDGYDFKVEVDVTTLSASAQAQEAEAFLKFINLITQYPMIAMSPKLLREAAYRLGYRNEAVIKEMQQMALLTQMGMQQGMNIPQPGQAQQGNSQTIPPDNEQIRNAQMGALQ